MLFFDSQFWSSFRVKILSLEAKQIPDIICTTSCTWNKNSWFRFHVHKCPQNTVIHGVFPAHVPIQGARVGWATNKTKKNKRHNLLNYTTKNWKMVVGRRSFPFLGGAMLVLGRLQSCSTPAICSLYPHVAAQSRTQVKNIIRAQFPEQKNQNYAWELRKSTQNDLLYNLF